MKKVATIAAVVAIVFLAVGHYVKDTPQYSLYKFSHAIKQHDADTAFQYIDVDAVVDNLFTALLQEKEKNRQPSLNPLQAMGDAVAGDLIKLLLPSFKEAARGEIRSAIQQPDKPGDRGVFKVFSNGGSWRDFHVERQGKIALVTKKSDKDFSLKLAQAPDGHWTIVQLMSKDLKAPFPNKGL